MWMSPKGSPDVDRMTVNAAGRTQKYRGCECQRRTTSVDEQTPQDRPGLSSQRGTPFGQEESCR